MVIGLHRIIGAMTKKHPLDRVAIVFEQSERGTPLVYRDFEWLKRGFYDSRGKRVQGDFCFAPKDAMEPGLELADLIAHTVGRQQRCWRKDWGKMEKDFEAVFHSVDKSLCEFMAVAETKITQLTMPAGEVEAFLRSLD
jgi:hypothetical protein